MTSIVARLRMIRKNLPRSWVSALSVKHHSKSDTCAMPVKTYHVKKEKANMRGIMIFSDLILGSVSDGKNLDHTGYKLHRRVSLLFRDF